MIIFLFIGVERCGRSQEDKTAIKNEIKKQLLELIIINEVVESEELNKEAEEMQEPKKAAKIIKQYEDIIKTKKKGIISIAYYQGKVFKRFKEKEKFIKLASQLGIHKNTIIFKINVFKLCEKCSKLLRSSIGLGFFKIITRTLKQFAGKMKKIFDNFLSVFIF